MVTELLPSNSQGNGDTPHNPTAPKCSQPPIADMTKLISDNHQVVYRYAFRLAGCQADAEDLTQQTFLIAQQKIHQVRDPAKTRSWLLSVLRSCFLKSQRKRQPIPAASLEIDVNSIPQAIIDDDNIDRQLLQSALNELPDEFKLVLAMFYFEECSYKEIAEKLKLPIGTVMSRLSRAKSRLRGKLLAAEASIG